MRNSPNNIQLAEIMDNRDPLKEGRVKVWIVNGQKKKTDKGSWITAKYATPFGGRTSGQSNPNKYGNYPKSYGLWMVPPDVGVHVFVFFVDGRQNECYFFASALDTGMNSMIPTSPSSDHPRATSKVPVTEYDRNSVKANVRDPYLNVPLMEGISKQNLIYDELRGLPNSSSRRQAPATVYGLGSPRGSSIYIDDGYTDAELTAPSWEQDTTIQNTERSAPTNDTDVGTRTNEEIRLRTRSGAQILISETEGNVFIINRDGTARVELTADGRVLIHAEKTVAIRSEEDINFIADRDINMTAGRNMNLNVSGNYKSKIHGTTDELMVGAVHKEIQSSYDVVVSSNYTLKVDDSYQTTVTNATKLNTSTLDVVVSGQASHENGSTELKSGNFNIDSTVNIKKATSIEATLAINGSTTASTITSPSIAVGALSVGSASFSSSAGANGVGGNLVISGSVWASDFHAGSSSLLGHTHIYNSPVYSAGPASSTPSSGGGLGAPGQSAPPPPTATQSAVPPTVSSTPTAVTPPTYADVLDVVEMNPNEYARKILSSDIGSTYGSKSVVTKDIEILDTITQDVYPTKGDPTSGE